MPKSLIIMHNPKSIKFLICALLFSSVVIVEAQQGRVIIDQDPEIAKLLEYKKDLSTIDFYKIQIFSNSKRSDAESARSEFRSSFNKYPTEIVYEPPNFKIWVGAFRDRLEADRAYIEIKKKYPNAFLFKPKRRGGR